LRRTEEILRQAVKEMRQAVLEVVMFERIALIKRDIVFEAWL
jgi:hypothetical protein